MSILSEDGFNVVYYSFPVPNNLYTIPLLGILFNKVYLPGVYLPTQVTKEDIISRLSFLIKVVKSGHVGTSTQEELNALIFLRDYKELLNIFVPTGRWGLMGLLEKETQPIVMEIEELVYGPPPPNFTPTPSFGFNTPVGTSQINAPSWISYPANAFIYARKNNLTLLSDSSFLPFPKGVVEISETDSKTLASYLMAASFSLVLPRIKPLHAQEILEIRESMKEDISMFKVSMLSGVSKFLELLGNNPTPKQLENQAKHIANTIILPKVEYLRANFESPKKLILKNAIDFSLEAPELILNFQKPEDLPWAILKVLSNVTKKVKEGLKEYEEQNKKELNSGLSLLLKVPRRYPKV